MTEVTSAEVSGVNDTSETVETKPKASLDAIANAMVSEKPPVSEHAIAQAEADAVAQEGKDSQGNAFNPAIHAVNADGSPRRKANGAYALKRGKKAVSTENSPPNKNNPSARGIVLPGTQTAMPAKEQESRAAGVGAANLMFALMQGLGGAEWAPRVDDKIGLNEKVMMEQAHADAFAAWGWGDLPPGLALAAAYAMYCLPRLNMPATKTRLQRFRGWIGAKIGAWRANRKSRRRGLPESDVERADRQAREKYAQERAANG